MSVSLVSSIHNKQIQLLDEVVHKLQVRRLEGLILTLNEAAADEIRKYRADYNNNPPAAIFFMSAVASTSGRLHSEFVRLVFSQAHRETNRFFAVSGVQLAQQNRSTTAARRSPQSSSQNVAASLTRRHLDV